MDITLSIHTTLLLINNISINTIFYRTKHYTPYTPFNFAVLNIATSLIKDPVFLVFNTKITIKI